MKQHDEIPLPAPGELGAEIDRFEVEAQKFLAGETDPDLFKRFRLKQGIYGQRQPGVQMVRIKIPFGHITSGQLRTIAQISEEYSTGVCHVTTRQDIQLHFVPLERVPDLLRRLAAVGLTTREACGNTVRNVTACPMAGICRDELFDITPYANAMARFFLRNPICEELPRKFKIAFSGCSHDCAMTAIHDFGVTATSIGRNGTEEFGFRVTVGGGLGPSPKRPYLLEEFLSPTELLPVCEAVLRVFSRFGNRKNRSLARIKFLLEKIGFETFYRLYQEELHAVKRGRSSVLPESLKTIARHPAAAALPLTNGNREHSEQPGLSRNGNNSDDAQEHAWRLLSVQPQRQPGLCAIQVRLVIGDITASALRALSDTAEQYAHGQMLATPNQNFLLRNVREADLPALYATLNRNGLALPAAETISDVIACPGTDTCGLGITSSKPLGRVLTEQLQAESEWADDLKQITIKISGCPNSCAQHHIASIGFHGVATKIDGRLLPAYQLHLGGRFTPQGVQFGQRFTLRFPAKRVPDVVKHLISLYRSERHAGESFLEFVDRFGKAKFQQVLAPFTQPSGEQPGEELFRDWGEAADYTMEGLGAGECATPSINFVAQHFDDSSYELAHAHVFLEKRQPFDAVTRADLAAISAARALLTMEEIEPISHHEVLKEFDSRIIAQQRIPPSLWMHITTMQNQRGTIELTLDQARDYVDGVRRLIDACRSYYEQASGAPLTSSSVAPQESPAD